MPVHVKTTSTVSTLLVKIAQELTVQVEDGNLSDPYRIIAPVVIENYDDLDPQELGYVPGGEFGLCHGRYDATPAKSVEDTVAMFMQIVKDLGWVYTTTRGRKLREIDLDAVDLTYRMQRMGLNLRAAKYPTGTWSVSKDRHSNVLHAFEDVQDPRVLYVVEQLERLRGIQNMEIADIDVIASHMLTTFDAGLVCDTSRGQHVATARTK